MKVHGNASTGSRVVQCGQKDRRTDMMKLIVAFCNFANPPKTPHELDMFAFSVKNLRLRRAPSDLIQQP
jgi:hypothetical protein